MKHDGREVFLIWTEKLDHLGEHNELWVDIQRAIEKHKDKYFIGFVQGTDHKCHFQNNKTVNIKMIE